MGNKLIAAIAAFFVVVAGTLTWHERQIVAKGATREAALAAELKEKTDALAAKEKEIADLKRASAEDDAARFQAQFAGREKATAPATPTPAAKSSPGTAGYEAAAELFRRALNDPTTRDVRYQWIWNLTKQVYGDFARMQRLSPEQTDKFLQLVFGRDAEEIEDGTNFFTGDKNGPGPSGKDAQAIAADRKEIDQALKDSLGDSGYALQEYEKGTSDREHLYEIRTQLAMQTAPLTEDQGNFLLQALQEERAKTPAVVFDPDGPGSTREKYRVAFDGDNAARYLEVQTDLGERFLQRAQPILTPEQYDALVGLQQQKNDSQKSLIEMARKVMSQANGTLGPQK